LLIKPKDKKKSDHSHAPVARPIVHASCLADNDWHGVAMTTIVQVTAAIIVSDENILIAQRHPDDRLAGMWEFPGGKIEAGETPEQCLKRELKEELEMDAVIGNYLGSSIYHYDHISIELMAYRVCWKGGFFRLVFHQADRWVRPDQLADYPFTPADLPFVQRLVSGKIDLG
jgi:8-oxo-dGTP diphosphatase